MKFAEGEEVLAKHPSTSEYYKGRILNVTGDRYKIKFETGSEHTVSENDIKYERVGRSATRTSSRISRKSPSRYSPSRKSPSRRSPSRRSPGRQSASTPSTRKLPIRSTRLAKISLSRIDVESDKISNHKEVSEARVPDDSPTETIPLQERLKEIQTSVARRPMRLSFLEIKRDHTNSESFVQIRNIDRASSLPIAREYPSRCILTNRPMNQRGYSLLRDQDLMKPLLLQESEERTTAIVEKREKTMIAVEEPQEWGGWIGTFLLMFLLPLFIILPQLLCSEGQCKTARVNLFADLKSYINWHGFVSYVVFVTVLVCSSIIPIGKKVDGQQSKIGRLQYRVNGFLNAILVITVFGLCIYKDIPISDYILNNVVQLSISGWLLGTILALGLYIKAEKASVAKLNIYASTNSKIYNFWQGREINPRIAALDIKLLLMRASLIGTLIVNTAVAIKAIGDVKNLSIEQLDVATLLVTCLQLFYVLDGIIYETSIFTSFAIMYEGTGYMICISHLLYPFLPTLTTRFILYQKPEFNYRIGIFILSFVLGYILYRKSNTQKNEFRNSISPMIPHLETIPTSRGKQIMLFGLWGYVRHPNYLGDIIMQWSFAGISLATDILPYYAAICCTLALAYRAIRDNKRCQARYRYAWEIYCSHVKYMILKYVF